MQKYSIMVGLCYGKGQSLLLAWCKLAQLSSCRKNFRLFWKYFWLKIMNYWCKNSKNKPTLFKLLVCSWLYFAFVLLWKKQKTRSRFETQKVVHALLSITFLNMWLKQWKTEKWMWSMPNVFFPGTLPLLDLGHSYSFWGSSIMFLLSWLNPVRNMGHKGKHGAVKVCPRGFRMGPSLNLILSPCSYYISPSLLRVSHLLHTSFDVL